MRLSASDPGQPEPAPDPAAGASEAGKAAEKAASTLQKRTTTQAQPVRQYLESTVVPVLMQGLQALCKERPDNPVEYLANYLLQHNPQKPAAPAPPPPAAAAAAAAEVAGAAGAPGVQQQQPVAGPATDSGGAATPQR